jgi:hypothetical protein
MRFNPAGLAVMSCVVAAGVAGAQPAKKTVVLGPQYGAGGFHRFFFGDDYRTMWTTPVELEVLDLQATAGGLTPVRRVGGAQTLGLALKSADGRNWTFRGSDKDPSSILPPDLQDTIAQDIVRDQIAAGMPAAPVVADTLMDAAGVMHPTVRMVVMPDDPALGEFRQAFAGVPGTFEEYPSVPADGSPGFGGALEILGYEKFHERLRQSPEVRVDARALLNARLLDVFMGDWDRHRKQWRWARLPDRPRWQPLPEDRDQAFSRFEGLLLDLGRSAQPRFTNFGSEYPGIKGLTYNGWEQDRQVLAELDAAAWDESAKALQAKLTDAVIDAAVARMPAEYQKFDAARLARDLKARRDRLPEEARVFYRHLAQRANVYATDADEQVEVEHGTDGSVAVRVAAGGEPYFARRFVPSETDEVRIDLLGGDDRVVTRGKRGSITVRVVGGDGNDVLDDSASGGTRFSDTEGQVQEGPGTHVDRQAYVPPPPNPKAPWIPPRDWGRDVLTTPWLGYGPDLGFFAGATVVFQSYGFRKDPYARRQTIRAGYSFGATTGKFDYNGDFRVENSGRRYGLHAYASGVETLHFYGFGNETPEQGDDEFHRVNQEQYLLGPSISWAVGPRARLEVGPFVKYSQTDVPTDRFIGTIQPPPYGADDFGQVGLNAGVRLDTRDRPNFARRGAQVEVSGNVYPGVWSVNDTFGDVRASAAAFLGAGSYFEPTLALRVGGKRVFGTYPFQEAAYVGGALTGERTTIRGFRSGRYAGDASIYANAELRFFLARFKLVLPADFGIFGLVDTGRVYLEGESSDQWHTGYGGGIWLAFLSRSYTFSASVATSEQLTSFYLRAGFGF